LIRVLLADDQALVRVGLRTLIEHEDGMELAGEAVDGEEAVAAAQALQPDVVLMDISMPGLNGVEATRKILDNRPEARVLMVTGSDAQEDVDAAKGAGATGYLTKDRIAAELVVAILDAAE
jgi:DNA-binding NarL/FixJ family response regulator